ncbi:universal stress protein [Salinigranum marinum]|uniref:universal stress protein n=1 Tax=Salinigranum marinum TaxID=1515595 RepID=UPI002989A1A4|nr:universal stress protein [Salinigranum marinum]
MVEDDTPPSNLLSRPFVPVASVDDARITADAVLDRIAAADGRITVAHVVEKAGGAPDKASVEQREGIAEEAFDLVRDRASAAGVAVETELLYGTDVAETLLRAAHDVDATAIVFTPRGHRWWWDLFSADVADALVHESDLPVVVLPSPAEAADDADTDAGDATDTEDTDE